MAARPTWKGFLKISLVNIPIRVFPATDSAATISFNQLHGECQTRIQQKRWCPHCEREVPLSEIVKGYEFEKGRYVVMDEEDLAKVRPESTRVIDLVQFTEVEAIDPIYVERPVLPGARWPDGAGGLRGDARGDEGQGRHRQAGALRPRIPRRRAAEGEGAGDVHDAARQRGAQHGQHRGARGGAVEGQAGRDQARQAGDRATSKGRSISTEYKDAYQEELQRIIDAKIAGEEVVARSRRRRRRSSI